MRDLLVLHCTRFFFPFPLITSPPTIAFSFSCPILASEMRCGEVVSKKVCKLTIILIFALSNKKQQEYGTYTRTNFGNYFELHK